MAIPFANRKAWADLPYIALRNKPTFTFAENHGDFSKVLRVSLESVFECMQVVSRTKLWTAFKDKNSLEETASVGLEFRGHPITLTPLHSKTWVSRRHHLADDTTVLVCLDDSLVALFQLFERYERASCARLNLRKYCGLLLGPWRARPPETLPIQLKLSSESIQVLGCRIHPAGTQDWGPLLGKLTTLVDTWKVRHLSFQGCTVVANTLGLSTFLYLGSVCFFPPTTIRQINRLVFPFVWSKKRECIRRSALTLPCARGGLGTVNLEWPTVWANLHHLRFLRQMRDTSWLISHGVLPTGVRLASFNMSVSPLCHCGRRETMEHLFCYCPQAQDLVSW